MERTHGPLLLVEDDAPLRAALWDLLVYEGYEVVAVGGGEPAVAYLREHSPPALVVLDLEMSGVDGWAVLREIAADARLEELSVVVFAGTAGACGAEADPHVRAVLSKPVFLDAFLAAVRQFHRATLPKRY